ncbi:MAG: hypothetical protein ACXVW5_21865 [Solirubrobacteraceae bacterium]
MNSHLTLAAMNAQQQDRLRAAAQARQAAALSTGTREPRTHRLRVLQIAALRTARALTGLAKPPTAERPAGNPAID